MVLSFFSVVQKGNEKRICFGKQETKEINADLNVKFRLIIILYVTIYNILLQTSCLSSYAISKETRKFI